MADQRNHRLAELERLDEDLFDFPDVLGMADLLAASRAQAVDEGAEPARAAAAPKKAAVAASPKADPAAPLPSAKTSLPRNADDLDEDLFGFGELMELSDSSGLGVEDALQDVDSLDGDAWTTPTPPKASNAPESKGAPDAKPVTAQEKAPASAVTKGKGDTKEPAQTAVKGQEQPEPENKPQVPAHQTPNEPAATDPTPRRANKASAPMAIDASGGPFLNFPNSIDLPPARSKLLWVLVGCFLLVNASIFLLTQQQSQSVNNTLMTVTSTLAEAFARGAQAPAPVTIVQSAPVEAGAEPGLTVLDPSDYANTQEFALAHARRLIQQGHYEDARRSLYRILASQDHGAPMTVALREDIDYLVAMTLFDQGKTLADEVVQR